MKIERVIRDAFVVIGKEGSTEDGEGFIQKLWQDANSHFDQVADLAKRDEAGNLAGVWGAMTDFSRAFRPWDDFCRGLYLAGVECVDDAEAPEGWTRWTIPAYEFLSVECEGENTFSDMLKYMDENHLSLAGAVHDHTDPKTGKNYMYFPVRKR